MPLDNIYQIYYLGAELRTPPQMYDAVVRSSIAPGIQTPFLADLELVRRGRIDRVGVLTKSAQYNVDTNGQLFVAGKSSQGRANATYAAP